MEREPLRLNDDIELPHAILTPKGDDENRTTIVGESHSTEGSKVALTSITVRQEISWKKTRSSY
jgi:hypothetical protein